MGSPNGTTTWDNGMAQRSILHNDQWGDIIDSLEDSFIEIRWFDTTSSISGEEFNGFLATFAECVERSGRPHVLVDALSFRMDPTAIDTAWRDANIIPRYNAAKVAKFAFIMPQGMPAIDAAPAPEGPATFPTGYFGSRNAALAWLLK